MCCTIGHGTHGSVNIVTTPPVSNKVSVCDHDMDMSELGSARRGLCEAPRAESQRKVQGVQDEKKNAIVRIMIDVQ